MEKNNYNGLKEAAWKSSQKAIREAHSQGYDAGYAQGSNEAYSQGYAEGHTDGYFDGEEKGEYIGFLSAINELKPAISDGLRHGSPECAKAMRNLKGLGLDDSNE